MKGPPIMSETVTAIEMAKASGVDPKAFRAALRACGFRWHIRNAPWTVHKDSPEYDDMRQVLVTIIQRYSEKRSGLYNIKQ
jgi:hypothetical protein